MENTQEDAQSQGPGRVVMTSLLRSTQIEEKPKSTQIEEKPESALGIPAERFDPRKEWKLPIAPFGGDPVDPTKYPHLIGEGIRQIEGSLNSVTAIAEWSATSAWYRPVLEGEDVNSRQSSVPIIDNFNRSGRESSVLYPTTDVQIATLQEFADRMEWKELRRERFRNNIDGKEGEMIEYGTRFPGVRVLLAKLDDGAIFDAKLMLQRPLTGDEIGKPYYLTGR